MSRDQSIKARLEEAWQIVITYTGDAYIVMSHAFVCHWDDSDCYSDCYAPFSRTDEVAGTCTPDRENLDMLGLAVNCHEGGGTLEDFTRRWAQRMVMSS